MALDYDLDLATHMRPAEALEQIASQFPELTWSEDKFFLFDETISISAIELRKRSQDLVKDAFGFTPTVSIGFRQAKDGDWEKFRDILLQATMLLLEHAQDAVLLFNGENVILQRLMGRLAFNADSGLWRDEDWLRRKVQIPFERRPLPSPYL
jgi:hypothetical protein